MGLLNSISGLSSAMLFDYAHDAEKLAEHGISQLQASRASNFLTVLSLGGAPSTRAQPLNAGTVSGDRRVEGVVGGGLLAGCVYLLLSTVWQTKLTLWTSLLYMGCGATVGFFAGRPQGKC